MQVQLFYIDTKIVKVNILIKIDSTPLLYNSNFVWNLPKQRDVITITRMCILYKLDLIIHFADPT